MANSWILLSVDPFDNYVLSAEVYADKAVAKSIKRNINKTNCSYRCTVVEDTIDVVIPSEEKVVTFDDIDSAKAFIDLLIGVSAYIDAPRYYDGWRTAPEGYSA